MSEINSINDLSCDEDNLNAGTERADAIIEQSLQRLGAGRSVLADKNGKLIAGNHVVEKARELGFDIETVHTTGNRLVVVVRDDLDLDQDARARELSIADNRASEVGLSWRMSKLEEMRLRYAGLKTDYLFSAGELRNAVDRAGDELRKAAGRVGGELQAEAKKQYQCPNCGHNFSE